MSKKIVVLLAIASSMMSCSSEQPQKTLSPILFSSHNQPSLELSKLLAACKIAHDNTLATIVKQTQQYWLRPAGVERFHHADLEKDKSIELMPLLKELKLIDECVPSKKHYRYCLVLGSTVKGIRNRLAYVIKVWESGVRFDELILLSGQRDLDKDLENIQVLTNREQQELPIRNDWYIDMNNLPTTETEGMKMVYDQAVMPDDVKKIPMVLVDAPKQLMSNGNLRRPNTGDTVSAWLDLKPVVGDCLVISSQPYVYYQDSVLRTVLPPEFVMETVGCAITEEDISASVMLDSVARWLYQEQIRISK